MGLRVAFFGGRSIFSTRLKGTGGPQARLIGRFCTQGAGKGDRPPKATRNAQNAYSCGRGLGAITPVARRFAA